MAEQIQKKKSEAKTEDVVAEDLPGKNEDAEALLADMDDLLDEIDGVLEQNAEEFVKNYVQKGGE